MAKKSGIATLKPAGHARNEQLKKRADNLATIADGLMNNTESGVYAVDPDKLKEEPEILKHLNFSDFAFEVTRPVPGFVYFWCFDRPTAISMKRAETRMWGVARGWEIVGNCSCLCDSNGREKHGKDCPYPESLEVKAADGRRVIGDVFLMRMDLNEYTKMYKRMLLVQRYRESNIPEPLSDWVKRHEGLVKVTSGNKEPADLYRDINKDGGPLQHSFRGKMVTADGLAGTEE